MTPMASIYGPDCDSQTVLLTQPETRAEAVSIVSAGVAYPEVGAPGTVASTLRAGRVWEGTESGCVDMHQLREAAGIEARAARKLDRFSLLALAAARGAVMRSKLELSEIAECGIYSGNMVGGWTFTEPQVRALHRDGLDAVSPYLATAWFPGAPQGQISINLGMTGFAKTVTTDRCSGAQAIGLAYERLRAGLGPALLLAGGAEAPVTPFVAASLAQIADCNHSTVEGAAYLLLAAGGRGEVEIVGHSTFAARVRPVDFAEQLIQRVAQLMAQIGLASSDIVLCNIPLDSKLQEQLSEHIRTMVGGQTEIFFTTEVFGDALAASGPLASVAAWEMLIENSNARVALVISLGHQCADLLVFSKPFATS